MSVCKNYTDWLPVLHMRWLYCSGDNNVKSLDTRCCNYYYITPVQAHSSCFYALCIKHFCYIIVFSNKVYMMWFLRYKNALTNRLASLPRSWFLMLNPLTEGFKQTNYPIYNSCSVQSQTFGKLPFIWYLFDLSKTSAMVIKMPTGHFEQICFTKPWICMLGWI